MGNHDKGNPLYCIKSLCSYSSRTSACSSLRNNPFFFESHYRHISLCSPGSCTSARSSLGKYSCLFLSHCRHISLCSSGSCTSARSSLQKYPCFLRLTIVIFSCLARAVAQVVEAAFGQIHVCSSLTVVIFL